MLLRLSVGLAVLRMEEMKRALRASTGSGTMNCLTRAFASAAIGSVACAALCDAALAGTPAAGTVFIGAAYVPHNLYRVDFQYDGADTISVDTQILVTLPTAADAVIVPGGDLIVAGQGSNVYKVDTDDGTYATSSTGNNGNTAVLDPSGQSVWIGWTDSTPSQVPLRPFGPGTPHSVSGDDLTITHFAFTPSNGAFYANGGESNLASVGTIDMSTFVTTRIFTSVPATSIFYDAYSRSLIFVAFGKATQVDPANPSVVISSRDDSALGENYLGLRPDGRGHLFGTRWGVSGENGGRLVLVDYSQSGLIGDASTIMVSAPMVDGLSGGVAVDTSLLANGFELPVR
jgi:hypothetical protein